MEKELIDSLNGWFWSLIAAFGGIGVIVTAIIVFVTNLMNYKLIQFWKLSSDKELEALRGVINRNNSITSSLSQQIGQNFQKLLDKRIEASEVYWNSVLKMKASIPSVVYLAYDAFSAEKTTKERLYSSKDEFGARIEKLSHTDFLKELSECSKDINTYQLFVSERLWILVFAYRAFIGRSTRLLIVEHLEWPIESWREETRDILEAVLTKEELEYIFSLGLETYETAFKVLESNILIEIKRMISSEDMTTDSLLQVKKMNQILAHEDDWR